MEFARILRTRACGVKTGIVMMVAHRTAAQAAQAEEIGLNGFVVKPLRKKQLAVAFTRASALAVSAVGPDAPQTTPQGRSGGPAAILLVEDNVVNQRVASSSLLKLGYAVEIASNGVQAVDAFEKRGFDLILMDCHMPIMDGYAATQKIRSSGLSGRYVPIIAMTADVLETQRQRCIAAGMNDFLSKPVKREVLSDMLQHWLAQA
jgi:CheY-like chemotaxis protein